MLPTPLLGVLPTPWSLAPKCSKQAPRDAEFLAITSAVLELSPCDIASSPFQHPSGRLPTRSGLHHTALEVEFTKGAGMFQLGLELWVGGDPTMPLGLVARETAKDGDPVGRHAISGCL